MSPYHLAWGYALSPIALVGGVSGPRGTLSIVAAPRSVPLRRSTYGDLQCFIGASAALQRATPLFEAEAPLIHLALRSFSAAATRRDGGIPHTHGPGDTHLYTTGVGEPGSGEFDENDPHLCGRPNASVEIRHHSPPRLGWRGSGGSSRSHLPLRPCSRLLAVSFPSRRSIGTLYGVILYGNGGLTNRPHKAARRAGGASCGSGLGGKRAKGLTSPPTPHFPAFLAEDPLRLRRRPISAGWRRQLHPATFAISWTFGLRSLTKHGARVLLLLPKDLFNADSTVALLPSIPEGSSSAAKRTATRITPTPPAGPLRVSLAPTALTVFLRGSAPCATIYAGCFCENVAMRGTLVCAFPSCVMQATSQPGIKAFFAYCSASHKRRHDYLARSATDPPLCATIARCARRQCLDGVPMPDAVLRELRS